LHLSNRLFTRSLRDRRSFDLSDEEIIDVPGDRIGVFFEREMPGVEQMKFQIL
jgi:hypothetical protein